MTDASVSNRYSESPALSPRTRAWLLLAVGVLHLGLGIAIVTGLASSAITLIQDAATAAYSVPLDPLPPPPANPVPIPEPAGDEGAAAKRAKPKPVVAAPARIPGKAANAAPVASTGDTTKSGATSAGTGTGGGIAGTGTGKGMGSGGNGDGAGSSASRAVKIAGDITATRDYPARTREQRIGKSVIVVLTVGTDGRVSACRIHQPSPDAEADAITCRLATQRFRFRPATDRAGHAITSEFGWQQRWFEP